jgi:NADH-quinone oxidoreductase subunit E
MDKSLQMRVPEKKVEEIIGRFGRKPGSLLGLLEATQEQNQYKYLPKETLDYISKKTEIPLSQIYSVITFYSFFNLKPQGEHSIVVCRGTACHTKGSKAILESVARLLGGSESLEEGEPSFTTSDNKFTIRTVACFGQCALSPVVSIDGIIHSNVTEGELLKIMNKLMKGGKK